MRLKATVSCGASTALAATETDRDGTTEAGGANAKAEATAEPDGATDPEGAADADGAADPDAGATLDVANELNSGAGAGFALTRRCDRARAESILSAFILRQACVRV